MRLTAVLMLLGATSLWWLTDIFWREALVAGLTCGATAGLLAFFKSVQPGFGAFKVQRLVKLLLSFSAFFLAIFWSSYWLEVNLEHRWPTSQQKARLSVSGQVCSIPQDKPLGTSFLLCVNNAYLNDPCRYWHQGESDFSHRVEGTVFHETAIKNHNLYYFGSPDQGWLSPYRLNHNLRKLSLIWYKSDIEINAGDHLTLDVSIKTPYSQRNPFTFDYERFAVTQSIDAVGTIKNLQVRESISNEWSSLSYWRQKLSQHLLKTFNESSFKGWHLALGMGFRDHLSGEQKELLQRSGVMHLIAISGLHIGLIFLFLFALTSRVWRLNARWCQCIPAHIIGLASGLAFAFLYAVITGLELPAIRALVALAIVVAQRLWLVFWTPAQSFSMTLIILLTIEPLGVLTEGFWLTITALAIIYWFIGLRRQVRWRDWFYLQLFLSIAMSLVSAIAFGHFSVSSVFSNIVAIPLVSYVLLPLELFILLSSGIDTELAIVLVEMSDQLINRLLGYLIWLDVNLPQVIFNQLQLVVLAYLIAAALVYARLRIVSTLCLFGLNLLLLVVASFWINDDEYLRVYTLDVGQGLSVIINHKSGRDDFWLVYDLGFANADYSTTKSVVLPLLTRQGVRSIDWLQISHDDIDHSGDQQSLEKTLNISRRARGQALSRSASGCRQQKVQLGNISITTFSMLSSGHLLPHNKRKIVPTQYPEDAVNNGVPPSGNNASCLLSIRYFGKSLLLTGDIEKEAELTLLQQTPDYLKADFIWVPHHGSLTSSTWSFVAHTDASLGIISAGYLNRFGHPNDTVVKRYQSLQVPLLNTAETGMITLTLRPNGHYQVSKFRETHHRLWNHRYSSRNLPKSVVN